MGLKEIFSSAIFLAVLTAALKWANSEFDLRRKRSQLYGLLKSELENLRRHCSVASREAASISADDIAAIRMLSYKDGGLFYFDPKESYLLNENLCQDLMQLSLLSRNDGLVIDELISELRKGDADDDFVRRKLKLISLRLKGTSELSGRVLANLAEFKRRPKSYRKPVIDWGKPG